MRILPKALAAVLLSSLSIAPAGAHEQAKNCTVRTRLDPACPVSRAGLSLSSTALALGAHRNVVSIFAEHAWQGSQSLSVTLPLYDHLHVASEGDVYGTGDLALTYMSAFSSFKRLTPFAGIDATLNSGGIAFTGGRSSIGPLGGFSYAIGNRLTFVGMAQYDAQAGGTKLPFAPRLQRLMFTPRLIFAARSGFFAATEWNDASITGDRRYRAYSGDLFLGVARERYDLTLRYSIPATAFTRAYVFANGVGLQASWRLGSR